MRRVLQGKGDEEFTTNVLDAEGSKTLGWGAGDRTIARQLRVSEGNAGREIGFELLYCAEAEISSVDKVLIVALTSSKPFIDGTRESPLNRRRAVHCQDGIGRVNARVPTRDRAIFGRKHENAWAGLPVCSDDKIIRIRTVHTVEDIASWRCGRPSRTTCRWRN